MKILAFLIPFNLLIIAWLFFNPATNKYKNILIKESQNNSTKVKELEIQVKKLKNEIQLYSIQLNEVGQVLTNENNKLKKEIEELRNNVKKIKPSKNTIIHNEENIIISHCSSPEPETNHKETNKGKYLLSPVLGYGTTGATYKIENGLYKTVPKIGIYYGLRGDYFLTEKTSLGIQINSNESFSLNYGYLFDW